MEVTDGLQTVGQSQPDSPSSRGWWPELARLGGALGRSFFSALSGRKESRTSGLERPGAGFRPLLPGVLLSLSMVDAPNCKQHGRVLFLNRLLALWGWRFLRVRTRQVPLFFLHSRVPKEEQNPATLCVDRSKEYGHFEPRIIPRRELQTGVVYFVDLVPHLCLFVITFFFSHFSCGPFL